MWEYNYNYLCHASYKYIDKYKNKSGKWTYIYENENGERRDSTSKGGITKLGKRLTNSYTNPIRPRSDNMKDKVGVISSQKSLIKNRKSGNVLERRAAASDLGVRQTYERKQNKALNIAIENAKKQEQNRRISGGNNADYIQSQRDKAIANSVNATTKYKQKLAAKQVEKEHRVKTAAIDSRNAREKAIEQAYARQKQRENTAKQEQQRRMASNTAERSQSAREKVIKDSSKKVQKDVNYESNKNELMKALSKMYDELDKMSEYLDGDKSVKFNRNEAENNYKKILEDIKSSKNFVNDPDKDKILKYFDEYEDEARKRQEAHDKGIALTRKTKSTEENSKKLGEDFYSGKDKRTIDQLSEKERKKLEYYDRYLRNERRR